MEPIKLRTVDDQSFNRLVLRSRLPVLVCFAAPWGAPDQALLPLLARLAAAYKEQLRVVVFDADAQPEFAEQFGIWAFPTLSLFNGGDELLRSIGFFPEPLVQLFFETALTATATPARIWLPSEQQFEDLVIAPLLNRWGFVYQRQVACDLRSTGRARGMIDFLVYQPGAAINTPLTLFENKRAITSDADLALAVQQAHGYAQSLLVPTFVIADPGGMRVYACRGERAVLVGQVTMYELEADDILVPALLKELLTPS